MRKITLMLAVALSVTTVSSFATGTDKGKKTEKKCIKGGSCCQKTSSRAALMKAKPVAKKKAA